MPATQWRKKHQRLPGRRFGILFIYGALRTEPTPLFEILVKNLTIRGYKLAEVTTGPARLERKTRFINKGWLTGEPQANHRQDVPTRGDHRGHRPDGGCHDQAQ